MRILLLFRGAPGCGKTTYIKEHNLKPWTLSPDDLRRLYRSPDMEPDGTLVTPLLGKLEQKVWATLFDMLKERMEHGELTVIDATNSRTEEMTRYKKLATEYRYRVFCVDMTDLPVDECKRRNAQRDSVHVVPESVIDRMYARFASQKIPSGIKVLRRDDDLMAAIGVKRIDLSKWSKIVHIGDVHGCATPLLRYFDEHPYDNNTFYIFLGDYLDRGAENLATLRFLMDMAKKPNTLFLEGNHERHLRDYSEERRSVSREFEEHTRPDLDESWTTINDVHERKEAKAAFLSETRQFCRSFGQIAWYTYHDCEVFCSHGGIPRLPETNLAFVPTRTLMFGAGTYGDEERVADTWNKSEKAFQVFGHRNKCESFDDGRLPLRYGNAVFLLEGGVEFGGKLRVAELTPDGWNSYVYQNTVVRPPESTPSDIASLSVENAVKLLRANAFVREKRFGNLSSFNFTREAFRKGIWDGQTVTARGLYIDVEKNEIALRGYRKFWNMGEMPETCDDNLRKLLAFPVSAYVKENGFLVLASVHEGKLVISTKSALDGPYAAHARTLLAPYSEALMNAFAGPLAGHTLLMECEDPVFDPHIISYDAARCVILDAVENTLAFRKMSYGDLVAATTDIGLPVKERAVEFRDWKDLASWLDRARADDFLWNGQHVEGFVLEDSAGYMVKIKLSYYRKWKMLRTVADNILTKGHSSLTALLRDPESNAFYGWVRDFAQTLGKSERHALVGKIIDLREKFHASNIGRVFS